MFVVLQVVIRGLQYAVHARFKPYCLSVIDDAPEWIEASLVPRLPFKADRIRVRLQQQEVSHAIGQQC
jgi:hypothetical protein